MKHLALLSIALAAVAAANFQISPPPMFEPVAASIATTPSPNNVWTSAQFLLHQNGPQSFPVQLEQDDSALLTVISDVSVAFSSQGGAGWWLRDGNTGKVLFASELDQFGRATVSFSTPIPLAPGGRPLLVEVGSAYNPGTFTPQIGQVEARISLVGRRVRSN